jgi:hypothetical protein
MAKAMMSEFTPPPTAHRGNPINPIKGPGLTIPGVIILQSLLIFFAELVEYKFTKVGILTGMAILISFAGGLFLGRTGTSFTAVVNPPIAFLVSTIFLMATVGGTGLHISKIGIDLISSMAGAAPYLIFGALLGWIIYLWRSRGKLKSA